MIQPIVRYPAGVLTEVAEPVVEFDETLTQLATDLAETCTAYEGVGLAAPQVGINKRVVYVKAAGQDPLVLVNPTWHAAPDSNPMTTEEGCLSLPGLRVDVERPDTILVEALSTNREPMTFMAEGELARILQHEIDHLEGTVIVDHLQPAKRSLTLHAYRKNLKKMVRRFNNVVRGRAA